MKHIVSIEWLRSRLGESNLVIVDCRFQLAHPNAGQQAYEESHIAGAVYLNLEKDLSSPIGEHGGRHPLPDIGTLAVKLGQVGIGAESIVVAYDDQGGAMASRLWWILRYLGHEQVYLLDEGFTVWNREGHPVNADLPQPTSAIFVPQPRAELLADVTEVRSKLRAPGVVLVDSREAARYRGEVEPLDPVAGHIPGARNLFWSEGRQADGSWKNANEQRERFAGVGLQQEDEIIVYCGSGVTATPNVLALSEAGFTRVKLYAGSWSDWISYAENPIAIGEE